MKIPILVGFDDFGGLSQQVVFYNIATKKSIGNVFFDKNHKVLELRLGFSTHCTTLLESFKNDSFTVFKKLNTYQAKNTKRSKTSFFFFLKKTLQKKHSWKEKEIGTYACL